MPDQNDLIIIEYPYEKKKPQMHNLLIEKPQQPMQNQITHYTFKHITNSEPDLLEDYDEFNNTLNEGIDEGVQKVKQSLKTEDCVISTITLKKNIKSYFNNSYSGVCSSNKSKLSNNKDNVAITKQPGNISLWRGNAKLEKNNLKYSFHNINNFNNKPIKIHQQTMSYCKNCEEVYSKCINDNTDIPLNIKCSYCNNEMNNDAFGYYKLCLLQIDKKQTRNSIQTNANDNDSLGKAKTVTQFKALVKNNKKSYSIIAEPKSVNNSFIDEKKLFTKRYSFLQLHKYSSQLIKKDTKKQYSKELTSRDYYKNSSKQFSHYSLTNNKHQSSLTISFGDENSQSLFEKNMKLKKETKM